MKKNPSLSWSYQSEKKKIYIYLRAKKKMKKTFMKLLRPFFFWLEYQIQTGLRRYRASLTLIKEREISGSLCQRQKFANEKNLKVNLKSFTFSRM